MISLKSLLNLFKVEVCPPEFQGSRDHTLDGVSLIQMEQPPAPQDTSWMISVTWAQEGVLRPVEYVWGQTQSPVSTRLGTPKLSQCSL